MSPCILSINRAVATLALLSEAAARHLLNTAPRNSSSVHRQTPRSPPEATLVAHSAPPSVQLSHDWPHRMANIMPRMCKPRSSHTHFSCRAACCTHAADAGACAGILIGRWRMPVSCTGSSLRPRAAYVINMKRSKSSARVENRATDDSPGVLGRETDAAGGGEYICGHIASSM